ncbi:MAG TPA: hypothetical protein VFK59_04995 [Actinomycetota bacterium]|nr:hypothetical protein [Actinomycetota bacterium]
MGTWQRKTAGVIVALVGVVLIGSIIVNDLFSVGPAFEDMSDGFRPVMTEETIATLEQDLQGMQAAGEEFQTTGVPMFSDALGMTPEEFTAFMQEQYPDVAAGIEQLPAITESFGGVVGTLEAELERFASADAIPTTTLPATTIPWGMLVAGGLLIILGVLIAVLRGRTAPIIAAVVGGLLVVVPFALSLPTKAADADQMNENLKPVYTQELLTGAEQSLAVVGAMGTQMTEEMLPALGAQLGMDEATLQAFLGDNMPAMAGVIEGMPEAMGRFTALVETFGTHLEDYLVLTEVAFVPIVWTLIVGGAIALAGALWALFAAGRRPVALEAEPVREPAMAA